MLSLLPLLPFFIFCFPLPSQIYRHPQHQTIMYFKPVNVFLNRFLRLSRYLRSLHLSPRPYLLSSKFSPISSLFSLLSSFFRCFHLPSSLFHLPSFAPLSPKPFARFLFPKRTNRQVPSNQVVSQFYAFRREVLDSLEMFPPLLFGVGRKAGNRHKPDAQGVPYSLIGP